MDIDMKHFFILYSILTFSQNPMMDVSAGRTNNRLFMQHVYAIYYCKSY